MASDDLRRRRLMKAGEMLADRWQSIVSEHSKVPQSTLAMIVKGDRKVTQEVEVAVANGIIKAADIMIVKAGKAKEFAAMLLLAIEKEK